MCGVDWSLLHEVESQTQKATQLPACFEVTAHSTTRPAKRSPTAIAGRLDEQAGGLGGLPTCISLPLLRWSAFSLSPVEPTGRAFVGTGP